MAKFTKKLKHITPFRYPNKRHIRTESPPAYKNYRSYKAFLKKEFHNRCVYCQRCDNDYTFSDIASFQVEHYRPKSLFPQLINTYTNLFYACASCNRLKSNYWQEPPFHIPNPCDDIMSHHVGFDTPKVVFKSTTGENMIRILKLNGERELRYRQFTQNLIIDFLKKLSVTDKALDGPEIQRALNNLSLIVGRRPDHVRKALGL